MKFRLTCAKINFEGVGTLSEIVQQAKMFQKRTGKKLVKKSWPSKHWALLDDNGYSIATVYVKAVK